VPHQLIRQEVEARITTTTVEIFHRGKRGRQPPPQPATAPPDHRRRTHAQFAPALSRLDTRAHPPRSRSSRPRRRRAGRGDFAVAAASEQGFRSCIGILRLVKRYGAVTGRCRLRPCAGARYRSYSSVAAILKNRREHTPAATAEPPLLIHENIRGPGYTPGYYH